MSPRVSDIVIVLGVDADEIRNSFSWFRGIIFVNGDWKEGQWRSRWRYRYLA
jgi:hypothetical protein